MSSGKCSLSILLPYYFPFLGSDPTIFNGQNPVSVMSDGDSMNEVLFVHFTLHMRDLPKASPSHFSSEYQVALYSYISDCET